MKRLLGSFIIASVLGACFDEKEIFAYRRCEADVGDCKCAFVHDGAGFCAFFCDTDTDCPLPETAAAVRACSSGAELKISESTDGICILECEENEDCPSYMECNSQLSPVRKFCTTIP